MKYVHFYISYISLIRNIKFKNIVEYYFKNNFCTILRKNNYCFNMMNIIYLKVLVDCLLK